MQASDPDRPIQLDTILRPEGVESALEVGLVENIDGHGDDGQLSRVLAEVFLQEPGEWPCLSRRSPCDRLGEPLVGGGETGDIKVFVAYSHHPTVARPVSRCRRIWRSTGPTTIDANAFRKRVGRLA